jgi:hypothetical protein
MIIFCFLSDAQPIYKIIIWMNNENDTDTFFVTKHNPPNKKSISTSLPSLELSSARTIRVKKDELQHLFDNYHLFK